MVDDDQGTLRQVAWNEIFPWLMIVRCFRLAIGLRVLVLAAVAVTLVVTGWGIIGTMFPADETFSRLVPAGEYCPWIVATGAVPQSPDLPTLRVAAGQAASAWATLSAPFGMLFSPTTTFAHLLYLLMCGVWALVIWAYFGAAITRLAAVRLACDERMTLGSALRHARSKCVSYMAAPMFPLIGVFFVALPVVILGLFLRFGFGILLAGLVWPLALLAGAIMAILLLGLAFGWPLMWATISAEGTDSFDALSRSYAYTFQRPLNYLLYAILAAIIGGLGWMLVSNFAAVIISLTYWAAGWGMGDEPSAMVAGGGQGIGAAGVWLIVFWVTCVKLLAVGYLYSFFFTAATAIYFLLRRDVDATEMDEVYLEEEEEQQTYGVPPQNAGESGAPAVDESGPETPPENQG